MGLVGLAAATKSEENPVIAGKIGTAQVMTCISWCTYPIVYLFPMFRVNPAGAAVGIQVCCWLGHLSDFVCQVAAERREVKAVLEIFPVRWQILESSKQYFLPNPAC